MRILASTSCEVHTFDPNLSPDTQTAKQSSLPGLHFHSVGLGRSSGPLQSLDDRSMHSFAEVMAALGHAWVDVLKVDIEGHEWDMFLDFFTSGAHLPATQLLVEFHWPGSAEKVWKVLDTILADRYRIFSVEPNYYCEDGACAKNLLEFAFIRVSDDGHVCSPHSHHADAAGNAAVMMPEGC
ncbi:probable methyltransferase-like protein 24 at N-terminal half [Coccomyxa sp. Obi]|nr:probable methyltransferase-like protein 24 at N-terminal half [Coccomyxa sp. Obi]